MAMTIVQYALNKLAEELAEAAIECAKVSQFGFESYNPTDPKHVTNLQRLLNELHDVEGAKVFLRDVSKGQFEFVPDFGKALTKVDKIERHLKYSIEMGYVEAANDCD